MEFNFNLVHLYTINFSLWTGGLWFSLRSKRFCAVQEQRMRNKSQESKTARKMVLAQSLPKIPFLLRNQTETLATQATFGWAGNRFPSLSSLFFPQTESLFTGYINLLSFSNDPDERSKYIESSTQTFLSGHTTIETRRSCDFIFNPALTLFTWNSTSLPILV